MTSKVRAALIWGTLILAMVVPILAAAASPLLAWRDPIYIAAGFAGVLGLALLLMQPLLAAGRLPGVPLLRSRQVHRLTGIALLLCVLVHVGGLWITSPPDVIDALLFASPTPFSAWGVIAMWGLIATACLATFRRRLRLRWTTWRLAHVTLGLIIVSGTVAHALLIEGTMEPVSKAILCALALLATVSVLLRARQRRA